MRLSLGTHSQVSYYLESELAQHPFIHPDINTVRSSLELKTYRNRCRAAGPSMHALIICIATTVASTVEEDNNRRRGNLGCDVDGSINNGIDVYEFNVAVYHKTA